MKFKSCQRAFLQFLLTAWFSKLSQGFCPISHQNLIGHSLLFAVTLPKKIHFIFVPFSVLFKVHKNVRKLEALVLHAGNKNIKPSKMPLLVSVSLSRSKVLFFMPILLWPSLHSGSILRKNVLQTARFPFSDRDGGKPCCLYSPVFQLCSVVSQTNSGIDVYSLRQLCFVPLMGGVILSKRCCPRKFLETELPVSPTLFSSSLGGQSALFF